MDKNTKKRVKQTFKHELKAIENIEKSLHKDFFTAVEILENRKGNIVVTGVGKSGFIAQKIAATLTSLGQSAFFLSPTDALHGDAGMVRKSDVIIALSYSGNTAELVKVVRYLKRAFKTQVISITGGIKSDLAETSDIVIPIQIEEEGCPIGLAPMASTTASLVVGDLLASALTKPEEFQEEHFAKFHPSGSLGLSLKKVREVMSKKHTLPFVKETDTFFDAIQAVTSGGKGTVAVVGKGNTLVGVLTDGDIRRIVLKHENPRDLPVGSVMTRGPKKVHEGATLRDALGVMEEYKITHLFVVEEGDKLTGIVHIHDIFQD